MSIFSHVTTLDSGPLGHDFLLRARSGMPGPAVLWRVRRAVANLKAIYRQEFGASAGIRVFPEPDPEVERGRRRRWWWVAVMGPAVVVLATLFGKRRV